MQPESDYARKVRILDAERREAHIALCGLLGVTPFDPENPDLSETRKGVGFVFFERFGIWPFQVPGSLGDVWASVGYAEQRIGAGA